MWVETKEMEKSAQEEEKKTLEGTLGVSKSSASKVEWFHLLHDGRGDWGGL